MLSWVAALNILRGLLVFGGLQIETLASYGASNPAASSIYAGRDINHEGSARDLVGHVVFVKYDNCAAHALKKIVAVAVPIWEVGISFEGAVKGKTIVVKAGSLINRVVAFVKMNEFIKAFPAPYDTGIGRRRNRKHADFFSWGLADVSYGETYREIAFCLSSRASNIKIEPRPLLIQNSFSSFFCLNEGLRCQKKRAKQKNYSDERPTIIAPSSVTARFSGLSGSVLRGQVTKVRRLKRWSAPLLFGSILILLCGTACIGGSKPILGFGLLALFLIVMISSSFWLGLGL